MFTRILIANRGEIARRLYRACRELKIMAIAIYSDPDEGAAWLKEADEAYHLPGTSAADTYLNQGKILAIATANGVEAIHPGYGFLSENSVFAAACAAQGIKFIGPSPDAMESLGSKARAREIAVTAGVPVTPGVDGRDLTPAQLLASAEKLGFPILIKASAGGGGKGMRVVDRPADFMGALQAAQKEAGSAFGSDHVILEKYLTDIHHIEVQVLGDEQGHIVHLFERECSIQRRHQKIIEETPSPFLTAELRQKICRAAVDLAQAAGYSSAGTVEFMVTGDHRFYLLEMNTRLQVEHPVTEMVTGIDLAQWQIRIAAGEPLPIKQAELTQRGHAIEARLYAEDPANGFLPSIGTISRYERPLGPGIRVDDGIDAGSAVTPFYDPMLGKIICHGRTREEALRKMALALRETVVLGVITNLSYLQEILAEPHFRAGETTTAYLEQHLSGWKGEGEVDELAVVAAGAIELMFGGHGRRRLAAVSSSSGGQNPHDPWDDTGRWRNAPSEGGG